MPIKPENRHRYPPDWPEIRERILKRADWHCEQPGCTAAQYDYGYWVTSPALRWVRIGGPSESYQEARQRAADEHWTRYGDEPGDHRIIVIVLTIAHLDHQPENCADDNLRALCQRHHLAYDHQHHQANAYATRRSRLAAGDLFAEGA